MTKHLFWQRHSPLCTKETSIMQSVILLFSFILSSQWYIQAYGVNPTEDRIFQGDILIRSESESLRRHAVMNRDKRWPGGVVIYTIDDAFDDREKGIILTAIDEIEDKTCLKWKKRTDEESYVKINKAETCNSEVGRTGGVQSISIEVPTCMKEGEILHLMMHTLGFLHEHDRPDRDEHITIVWGNVQEGMEDRFKKLTAMEMDVLGLPYDYKSVMHYNAYVFTKFKSQPTIMPIDKRYPFSHLGYGWLHGDLTFLDVQKIKKFYECPSD